MVYVKAFRSMLGLKMCLGAGETKKKSACGAPEPRACILGLGAAWEKFRCGASAADSQFCHVVPVSPVAHQDLDVV